MSWPIRRSLATRWTRQLPLVSTTRESRASASRPGCWKRLETRCCSCARKTIWLGECLTTRPFSPTWAMAPRGIRYRFQKSPLPVAVTHEFRPCAGLPADLLHRAEGGEQHTTDRSRGAGIAALHRAALLVIPAAEVLLQPAIERDEQIAAAHLPDLEFRDAAAPVAPGDGHHGPGVAAHDDLERQFHGEVEVRREKRAAPTAKRTAHADKKAAAPAKKAAPAAKRTAPAATKAAPAATKMPGPTTKTAPEERQAVATKKAASTPAPPKRPTVGPYANEVKFLEEQRAQLLEERDTHRKQSVDLRAEADSLALEREPGDVQFDEESGEGGTVTVDRERNLALSVQAGLAVEEIDDALKKIERKTSLA